MPQIQDPELAERLRRKFSIVGSSAIDTIAPELVGVVVVDEVLPAIGRDEGMLSQSITGDTGDIPEVGIRNIDEVRSMVIDRIQFSSNSGGVTKLRLGDVGGTELAAAIGQVADFRGQTLLSPAHAASAQNFNTVTGAGTVIWQSTIVPNTPYDIHPNLVIAPAGTIVGVNVVRDVVHMDMQLAAAILRVNWFYHFVPAELRAGV